MVECQKRDLTIAIKVDIFSFFLAKFTQLQRRLPWNFAFSLAVHFSLFTRAFVDAGNHYFIYWIFCWRESSALLWTISCWHFSSPLFFCCFLIAAAEHPFDGRAKHGIQWMSEPSKKNHIKSIFRVRPDSTFSSLFSFSVHKNPKSSYESMSNGHCGLLLRRAAVSFNLPQV